MHDIDDVRRVKDEVAAELMRLPGVTGVGVGHKIVDGRKTPELAIRVYVNEKMSMPPETSIPKDIQGIPTDVVERSFVLHSDEASEAEEDAASQESSPQDDQDVGEEG